MPFIHRTIVRLLWFCLLVFHATSAPSLPSLNIKRSDTAFAHGWNIFTSVIEYDEVVDESELSNKQLRGLARQAFYDMQRDQDYINLGDSGPKAMTAMSINNRVFFASSTTGGSDLSFFYDWLPRDGSGIGDPMALSMLRSCQIVAQNRVDSFAGGPGQGKEKNGRHRSEARCGEPMVVQMFYIMNPDVDLDEPQVFKNMRHQARIGKHLPLHSFLP